MNALKVFENKVLRQNNSPTQKVKSWRTEINKEIQNQKEIQDKLRGTEL